MWMNLQILLCLMVTIVLANDKSRNTLSGSSKTQNFSKQKMERTDESLKLAFLRNENITCNDGTTAGFYFRKSRTSKNWIVFLEGGGYCSDTESCKSRWQESSRVFMTSSNWSATREIGGILSSKKDENPYWSKANHVFLPYCSSDSWSGTKPWKSPGSNGGFSFMGAEIVSQVVRDLIPLGLENASSLILAGSSAGGIGVMLNLNRVKDLVHNKLGLKQITVRGISDSGWFLDNIPHSPTGMSPINDVKKGIALWQAKVPKECAERYPGEEWKCYFGYKLYPTLTAPLFVFQWLFDEVQLKAANIILPQTTEEWNTVHTIGDSLKKTFENVSAVFAPSCISHTVLTNREWSSVKIDDTSLPSALHCWKNSLRNYQNINETSNKVPRNQPCAQFRVSQLLRDLDSDITTNGGKKPIERRNKRKHNKNRRKNRNNKDAKNRNNKNGSYNDSNNEEERRNNNRRNKEENKQQGERKNHQRRRGGHRHNRKHSGNNHTVIVDATRPQRSLAAQKHRCTHEKCDFRFIDKCHWPQCNHACPKLHNPVSGAEIGVRDVLVSFGLKMKNVSAATGIDIEKLNTMGHKELINLLTQRER